MILVVVIGMLVWAVSDFFDSKENSAERFENADGEEEIESIEEEEKIENSEEEGQIDNENKNEEVVTGLDIGNMAPDFQLETLTGDKVKLSDFRGHRVMINFWATWCPPCRAEMPDMEKFHQDKEIVILAVNLTDTESSIKDVNKFADEYQLTFHILMDSNLDVSTLYHIHPIPTTYMIDSNGLISFKAFGAMNYDMMVQEFEKMK